MEKEKLLGIDLGVNSIGWALVEMEEGEKGRRGGRIVDMGVIIPFPGNKDVSKFEKGENLERNKDRRMKRMMRRLLYRRKRRKEMIRLLGEILDCGAFLYESNGKKWDPKSLYEDRIKGLREQIPLSSFLRILYLFTHRRGVSHPLNWKRQFPVQAKIIDEGRIEIVQSPSNLKWDEIQVGNILSVDFSKGAQNVSSWIGKRCYGIVKRKKKKDEFTPEFENEREVVEFIQRVSEGGNTNQNKEYEKALLYSKLLSASQVPGVLLKKRLEENREYGRIRGLLFHREDYKEEFNRLWEEQAKHYPQLNDPEVLERYKRRLNERYKPKEAVQRRLQRVESLQELVRDWVIFYQRPLKPAIGRGECFYEKGRRTIARSHPLFQVFRLWQTVQNMTQGQSGISAEEKWKLFFDILLQPKGEYPNFKELTPSDIKSILEKVEVKSSFSNPNPKTFWIILSLLTELPELKEKIEEEIKERPELLWEKVRELPLYEIWLVLYSSLSEQDVKKGIRKVLVKLLNRYQLEDRFTHEQIERVVQSFLEAYVMGYLEEGYGSLSAKAIKKLLQVMIPGDGGKGILPHPDLEEEKRQEIQSKLEMGKGLMYSDAAIWVYGEHTAQYGTPYSHYNQLRLSPNDARKIRHPIVKGLISATLRLIREIWKTYGKPDRIHIEFARELRSSPKQRRAIQERQKEEERKNRRAKEFLNDYGIPFNLTNIRKYRLWEEVNKQCLYCGETIEISELFSENVEIDHIIPKSIWYNNSYANLVVVCRKCNKEKGNQTAFDYLISKGRDHLRSYLERIKYVNGIKEKIKSDEDWMQLLAKYLHSYKNLDEIKELFSDSEWKDFLRKDIKSKKRKRKEIDIDPYWDKKLWHLLASVKYGEDELRTKVEFLANQLQATRYASRSIRPYLERIAKVLITSGGVTAYLRDEAWKLNRKVWEPLLKVYREIEKRNEKEDKTKQLNSKRDDFRNHALDALVIALTTNKDIKNINTYKGKSNREKSDGGKETKSPFPLDPKEVLEKLREVIVVYRYRRRVKSKWKGRVSIRGSLHKDTRCGLVLAPPITEEELRNYLDSVVFRYSKHADWLKNQWGLYQWWKRMNSDQTPPSLKEFWNILWQGSKRQSSLYKSILRDGEKLVENGLLQNQSEEKIIKKLASKILREQLKEKRCKGIALSRFAIVERIPLEEVEVEKRNGNYKISQFFVNLGLKKELEEYLNKKEIRDLQGKSKKLKSEVVKKINEFRMNAQKPVIKKVRVEKNITSISSFSLLKKAIVELESSYVAYDKDEIYTLFHIIQGKAKPPENPKMVLHRYDLVLVKQKTLEQNFQELVKSPYLQDRLFVVRSLHPSNGTVEVVHHSFSKLKMVSLSLNSIERIIKVSLLGKER